MSADEIRRVLGWTEWTSEPLTHNAMNAVTRGIWRITADRPVILKVLTGSDNGRPGWESSHDPRHWNYWRREAEVYAEGLPRLWKDSGLRAPEPLAVVERDDGDVALYLEDVSDGGASWSLDRHALMALQLGRAQGGTPEIERPWLSRSFLRGYVGSKAVPYELLDDGEAWRHPLVRDHFPEGLRGELVRLHRDREWFLELTESLPRALCHLDLWPNNLVSSGPDTVLLDWAFVGDGALGEDLGNHIPDSVFDLFVPAADLPALDRACYGSYVRGLREAGWRGDERLVRLAVCASAIKYDWLVPGMLRAVDSEQLDYGGARPVEAARRYRERGQAMMFLVGWADEARRLAETL
ncbi:phosphotransferase [Nonomuraea sp. NPDC049152]|uniref:phosphotransferase n=1 Tax=Nonomuraea sp. NPDC049152 TaxID=3154350 RepID=UPI0033E9B8D0